MATTEDTQGLAGADAAAAGDDAITLINIFELDAGDVPRFVEGWRRRAQIMSTRPGFVSARLHRALSPSARFQLVNVSRWRSLGDYDRARESGAFQDALDDLRADASIAVSSTPAVYREVVVAEAPAAAGR